MKKIILASNSPRRRELLELAGFDFEVVPSGADENAKEASPSKLVMKLSELKSKDVAQKLAGQNAVVIGADTVVALEGKILGKPSDEEDAFKMLKALSGKTHTVYTGVTLTNASDGNSVTFYEATDVTFYACTEEELKAYIATKEPMDKAGSYGIQGRGALLVEKINGDYYNVVGLPISRLVREMGNFSSAFCYAGMKNTADRE